MTEEPVLAVDDIQGMIVPGYRKPVQNLLHFRVEDVKRARAWLATLYLTSAAHTLKEHRRFKSLTARFGREPRRFKVVFQGCAFSAAGLRRLIGEKAVAGFTDQRFKDGLAAGSEALGDPTTGPGSPAEWVIGGSTNPVDMMIIVAGDEEPRVEGTCKTLLRDAGANGLSNIHIDRGRERPGDEAGHEQFGFKDGISRPALRGRKSDAEDDFLESREAERPDYRGSDLLPFAGPGRPLLWPGQILFGYDEQKPDDPEQPTSTTHPGPEWSMNGSFLIFRRLRQDVSAFNTFLDASVTFLNKRGWEPALDAAKLGAMMVGRWRSGAPIMLSPTQDSGEDLAINDFGFDETRTIHGPNGPIQQLTDNGGLICPRGAHIRKVNPRDLETDKGPASRTLLKLMLRRGITYDLSITEPSDPTHQDDRGLLFLAFHRSIQDSFDFLMVNWVRRPEKPEDAAGHDPILSQAGGRVIRLHNNGNEFSLSIPGGWVTPTGGEYFFMPGRSFFHALQGTIP